MNTRINTESTRRGTFVMFLRDLVAATWRLLTCRATGRRLSRPVLLAWLLTLLVLLLLAALFPVTLPPDP